MNQVYFSTIPRAYARHIGIDEGFGKWMQKLKRAPGRIKREVHQMAIAPVRGLSMAHRASQRAEFIRRAHPADAARQAYAKTLKKRASFVKKVRSRQVRATLAGAAVGAAVPEPGLALLAARYASRKARGK